MIRRLLNLLTALSLVLCVGVAALWSFSARSSAQLRLQLPAYEGDARWIVVAGGRARLVEKLGLQDGDPMWGETYEIEVFGVTRGGSTSATSQPDSTTAGGTYACGCPSLYSQ
jgi:hypothetical protein